MTTPNQPTQEQQRLNAMTHEQRMEHWARQTAQATGTVRTIAVIWALLTLVGVLYFVSTGGLK